MDMKKTSTKNLAEKIPLPEWTDMNKVQTNTISNLNKKIKKMQIEHCTHEII